MELAGYDSWIGRTLGGRYKILEAIGEGGMGVIYRAIQISVDRPVAIKMMHARCAQDPKWTERFQSEAKACSLLTHPNTVRLYDFGQTTLGNFYMVMELLHGLPLNDVILADAPIEAARVLRIVMQVCASLAEAHKAGIIHRDIKPENIFVQELEGASDFIKLFDFSIAKRTDFAMTATGIIMGTPQFMSPEQGRGEAIDARSDLYSLGIVAYAMLSGTLPFNDSDPLEVLRMHQSLPVPSLPPSVPDSVASMIMSCLDKNPKNRPASALALLEASRIWLTELDPTLDVLADPVLKNTIVTGSPAMGNLATALISPLADQSQNTTAVNHPASGGPTVGMPAEEAFRTSSKRTVLGTAAGMNLAVHTPATAIRPSSATVVQPYSPPIQPPAPKRPTVNEFSSSQVHRASAPDSNPPPVRASDLLPIPEIPQTGEHPALPKGNALAFGFICLLVALAFGFGGYVLTATLR